MNEQRLNVPICSVQKGKSRRGVLKRMLGLGMAAFGTRVIDHEDTVAARRGYSNPSPIGYGFTIYVTEGSRPGQIQIGIAGGSGFGRGITFYNGLSSDSGLSGDLEIEVIPPEADMISDTLAPGYTLWMRIHQPGQVRWRVWRFGDAPGEYRTLDFLA